MKEHAIGIQAVPYVEDGRLHSHFFGPVEMPEAWLDDFSSETIFFALICLDELKGFNLGGKLPDKGYLYIFLDLSQSEYQMRPIVRYSEVAPTHIVDDFNDLLSLEGHPELTKKMGMRFESVEADAEGHKLLGVPCDWNYPSNPKPLLLTISHLEEDLGFLPQLDGFTYIFFGPKGKELEEAFAKGEIS